MADVSKYGFLVDRDVAKSAGSFPRKRTHTTVQMGLAEDASDEAIVRLAWERELTIVTGNGDDFLREMLKFQRRTAKRDCHDLFGLIILPSGFEIQRRVLAGIEEKLRFGGKQITWADVWRKNYCVRIAKNGNPTISTFPQCIYCRKLQEK